MSRKTTESKAVDQYIGTRIRQYRIQRGLSQNELAHFLGISYQQLHKYENGANSASASRLADIAKVLKIKAADLFNGFSEDASAQAAQTQPMYGREQLLLMKYLNQIEDSEKRQAICDLIHSLRSEEGEDATHTPDET